MDLGLRSIPGSTKKIEEENGILPISWFINCPKKMEELITPEDIKELNKKIDSLIKVVNEIETKVSYLYRKNLVEKYNPDRSIVNTLSTNNPDRSTVNTLSNTLYSCRTPSDNLKSYTDWLSNDK